MNIALKKNWNRIMDATTVEAKGWLISACDDHSLKVFDVENNCGEIKTLNGHSSPVRSCCSDQSGKWMFSCGADRKIIVWNLDTLESEFEFEEAHSTRIFSCSCNLIGNILVTCSEEGLVKIWNWDNAKLSLRHEIIAAHYGRVSSCNIHNNQNILVTVGEDKLVKIWNANNGEFIEEFRTHNGRVIGCEVSKDSELIVSSSSDSKIIVYSKNKDSNQIGYHVYKIFKLQFKEIRCCSISQCKEKIVVGYEGGGFAIFCLKGFKLIYDKEDAHKMTVRWCQYSTKFNRLITASEDSTISFWTVDGLSLKKTIFNHSRPIQLISKTYIKDVVSYTLGDFILRFKNILTDAQFNSDHFFDSRIVGMVKINKTIFVALENGSIFFSSGNKLNFKFFCKVSGSSKGLLAFNKTLLLVYSGDGMLELINTENKKVSFLSKLEKESITNALILEVDNLTFLMIASISGRLNMFSIIDEEIRFENSIRISEFPIWDLCFNVSNNKLYCVDNAGKLIVVGITNGAIDEIMSKSISLEALTSINISDDLLQIITTSFDCKAYLLDCGSLDLIASVLSEGAFHNSQWVDKESVVCIGNYGFYHFKIV